MNHTLDKLELERGPSTLLYKTQTRFFFADPRPEEIFIEDIAYNLSRLPRWLGGGTGRWPYSIGQHSLLVSTLLRHYFGEQYSGFNGEASYGLAGLLHDAEEAYTNDVSGPMKHLPEMAGYAEIGDNIRNVILRKFFGSLQIPLMSGMIRRADRMAACMEMKQLIARDRKLPSWWPREYTNLVLPDWYLTEVEPATVEKLFLAKFFELTDVLKREEAQ